MDAFDRRNFLADRQLVRLSASLSPVIVAANTTAEQTVAFAGLLVGDEIVAVLKPTAQAGLAIGQSARVPSAGNLALTFVNDTGAGITPTAAETYVLYVAR